jgi:hypothetical protein
LTAVCTAYATPPFLAFFHPPIELASFRPCDCLDLDRRIDFSAIYLAVIVLIAIAVIIATRGQLGRAKKAVDTVSLMQTHDLRAKYRLGRVSVIGRQSRQLITVPPGDL